MTGIIPFFKVQAIRFVKYSFLGSATGAIIFSSLGAALQNDSFANKFDERVELMLKETRYPKYEDFLVNKLIPKFKKDGFAYGLEFGAIMGCSNGALLAYSRTIISILYASGVAVMRFIKPPKA
jgi:hypothetical protein